MTASSYSVNILLDATKAKSELASLEKRVNTFRQKMMKAISFEDKAARKKEKEIRDTDKRRTADIRDAYFKKRVRDLELKGVKGLEEANKQLEKTQEDINKKAYGALRSRLKIVKDEINAAVRLNNEKAKGVAIDKKVKPFPVIQNPNLYGPQQGGYTYGAGQAPVSIDARYNQQVRRAGFENRINMLSAQGVDQAPFRKQLARITQAQAGKKGTNFGLLKKENREMDKLLKKAESKLRLSKKELQVNKAIVRDKAQMVKAEGDFSMLSDRKSYDVKGRRTFANNRFGRALGGKGFDRAAGVQGALISGAFPLLFGQGPAVAAAGALGGGLGGGLFGQGGSFAGGIAATAAVTAISGAVNAVKELGQAMGPFTQDTDALMAATGQANTFREKEIKLIEKLQGKEVAFNEAMKDMVKVVGENGVKALKEFGEDTKKLSEDWSRFITKMSAGLARLINWTGLLGKGGNKEAARRREELAGKDAEIYRLQQQRKDILTGFTGTGKERSAALDQNMEDTKARIIQYDYEQIYSKEKEVDGRSKRINNLKLEIGLEAQRLTQRSEEQDVIRKTNELKTIEAKLALKKVEFDKAEEGIIKVKLGDKLEELRLQRDLNEAQLENARILADPVQAAVIGLQKELNKLNDMRYQLVEAATAIGNAFSESFKGIVSGSMTAQQALANLFQRTADHFLDMAAQMIAKQIQMKILGIGLDFAGYGYGSGIERSLRGTTAPTNVGELSITNAIKLGKNFADGGRPPKGRASLVGERGPELFVPDSAGTIIPNHAMGGTNVVVNVDASGSSVEGDAGQAEQLGSMLAAAVQAEIANQQRPGGLLASR